MTCHGPTIAFRGGQEKARHNLGDAAMDALNKRDTAR